MTQDPARLRLGRIRCLREAIRCLTECRPLPEALCFVPKTLEYISSGKGNALGIYQSHSSESKKLGEVKNDKPVKVLSHGLDLWNDQGQWIQLTDECLAKLLGDKASEANKTVGGWMMVVDSKVSVSIENGPYLMPIIKKNLPGLPTVGTDVVATKWEDAVEYAFSVRIGGATQAAKILRECSDTKAVEQLRQVPNNWSLEHDSELAKFAVKAKQRESSLDVVIDSMSGELSEYLVQLRASSENDEAQTLMDGGLDTYWESDGNTGKHWLRLHVKAGVVVRRLSLFLDEDDGNFLPQVVEVAVGNALDSLSVCKTVEADVPQEEMTVLENASQPYRYIELRIKKCFSDGVDTRIRGIKLVPAVVHVNGLSQSMFDDADFTNYPKLDQNIPKDVLHRRAIVLKRAITLFDSVVCLITPSWNYSLNSFGSFTNIRQLLFLSNIRNSLLGTFLRSTCAVTAGKMPVIHLNRRLARDHSHDPTADATCKNALFSQMYEALKAHNCGTVLEYRWPGRQDQWWECMFSNEGMIDQGGGFRETLSEISEELCPSASDVPVPLKLFCRTPNQLHDSSNLYRDMYIPTPGCDFFTQYTWIGQLMGACLRSREHLVLSLPPYIWKQLCGETVTWEQDFATVDTAQVKMLESLVELSEEGFAERFGNLLTYSVSLSDGTQASLLPNGAETPVTYEQRMKYAALVKKVRMEESKKQIDAIRKGLLLTLPQAVLDLVTWQELEQFICGDPDLPVDSMRKTAHYDEGLSESSPAVKNLWAALETFSTEERSRFLRFVTGRRRLPAPLWLCPGRWDGALNDALPESATCSSTLFLPNYPNAKVAAEKIRYAAYHCVAIDTDTSPYDDGVGEEEDW
eukprot:scpid37872/ scgid25406/ E3 ubiquitin-protein ligase HECTD3; HECT domain-containing protein 3